MMSFLFFSFLQANGKTTCAWLANHMVQLLFSYSIFFIKILHSCKYENHVTF